MKRALFSSVEEQPDVRPTFLAMSALMMILLPTLLLVTTPQKLVAIPLSIAGTSTKIPPPPNGIVERIRVEINAETFVIEARVRNTDVLAKSGDIETKTWTTNSWEDCLEQLAKLKQLDPQRQRIQIAPAATSPTHQVIYWMDTLQTDSLFPEVIVETSR